VSLAARRVVLGLLLAATAGRATPTPTPTPTSSGSSGRPERSAEGAESRGAQPPLEQAAPREVKSRLLKAQPRLGEPFDWEIELRHAPDESYALPARLELPPFQAAPLGCRRAAASRKRAQGLDHVVQHMIVRDS